MAKLQAVKQVGEVERVIEEQLVFGSDFPNPNTYRSLPLYFESDGSGSFAQRLVWLKKANLRLDYIEVLPIYKLLERGNLWATPGIVVEDPSSLSGKVKSVRSSFQPPGLLAKGNFVEPWKRSYTFYVSLKTSDNGLAGPLARLKVRSSTGRQKTVEIAANQFRSPNVYQNFDIEVFTGLPDPSTVEDRIKHELYEHGKTIWVLEVEDSQPVDIGISKLADASAINGFARRSSAQHAEGYLVVAAQPDLSPGVYVVAFRMKAFNIKGEDPAAWIDVNPQDSKPVGREITPIEFGKTDVYRDFFLGFSVISMDQKQAVQYRVLAYADADIAVDRLEVREVDAKLMARLYAEAVLRQKYRKQASFQVDYLGRADLYLNSVFLSTQRSVIYEVEDTQLVDIGINKVKDPSAHNGFSRNSTARHPPGYMILHPKQVEDPPVVGTYVAHFWLKVPDNTKNVRLGRIEVVVYQDGEESIVLRDIRETDFAEKDRWQPFSLNFKIDSEVTSLQYRMLVTLDSEVWADYIEVTPVSTELDVATFATRRGTRIFENRTLDKALFANAKANVPGMLCVSPKLFLGAGNYVAGVRLKASKNKSSAGVATFTTENADGKQLEQRVIRGTDFQKTGKYQIFSLSFECPTSEQITLKLGFVGHTDLWCDYFFADSARNLNHQ